MAYLSTSPRLDTRAASRLHGVAAGITDDANGQQTRMSPSPARRHGRSGALLVLAAAAAMLMAISGCEDDAPAPGAPGQGSQVGVTTGTAPAAGTSPATTGAANPNAAGGGAGTATSAP